MMVKINEFLKKGPKNWWVRQTMACLIVMFVGFIIVKKEWFMKWYFGLVLTAIIIGISVRFKIGKYRESKKPKVLPTTGSPSIFDAKIGSPEWKKYQESENSGKIRRSHNL